MSHSVIAGSLGGMDTSSESSHLRHGSSVDLSHASRMQREAVSPSYQSPMALPAGIPHKADSSLQGPPAFLTAPPPTGVSVGAQHLHPEGKLEHSGHCSTDMVQLLKVGQRKNHSRISPSCFCFETMIFLRFQCVQLQKVS